MNQSREISPLLHVQYLMGFSLTSQLISPVSPQVVEENGVRRVVVVPHSGEFHPSMHPPPPPPPPHVPHYMHHPHALLPPPPHPVFPAVPGTGELPPQFMHQPPPPHVFQEQGESPECPQALGTAGPASPHIPRGCVINLGHPCGSGACLSSCVCKVWLCIL